MKVVSSPNSGESCGPQVFKQPNSIPIVNSLASRIFDVLVIY